MSSRSFGRLVFSLLFLALTGLLVIAQNHALPPPVGGITLDQVVRLSQSGLSDDTTLPK